MQTKVKNQGEYRVLFTCRCGPEHGGLDPRHAEVPDAVSVAHILSEQLAYGSGCGGFETGHNLRDSQIVN